MSRPKGSKNKKGVTLGKLDRKVRESATTEEVEVDNRCMKCDNGRIYIYCYRDDDWKEKNVCLNVCSDGGRNRCISYNKHILNKILYKNVKKNKHNRKKV